MQHRRRADPKSGARPTFVQMEAARYIDNSGDIIIFGSIRNHRVTPFAVTCTMHAKTGLNSLKITVMW